MENVDFVFKHISNYAYLSIQNVKRYMLTELGYDTYKLRKNLSEYSMNHYIAKACDDLSKTINNELNFFGNVSVSINYKSAYERHILFQNLLNNQPFCDYMSVRMKRQILSNYLSAMASVLDVTSINVIFNNRRYGYGKRLKYVTGHSAKGKYNNAMQDKIKYDFENRGYSIADLKHEIRHPDYYSSKHLFISIFYNISILLKLLGIKDAITTIYYKFGNSHINYEE